MVRYLGPRRKIVSKLGNLPGLTQKIKRDQSNTQEADLGDQKRVKVSAYKIRLNEKQKLRYYYGINEKQLINYVKEARRRKGLTGFILMQLLEMRLDNIVFRLNLAPTIPAARQLINHGHIRVNSKSVTIASFQCQPKDVITISKRQKIIHLIETNLTQKTSLKNDTVNDHIEFDSTIFVGKVHALIQEHNFIFNVNDILVIEYYSRLI